MTFSVFWIPTLHRSKVLAFNSLVGLHLGLLGPYSFYNVYISFTELTVDISISTMRRWAYFLSKHTGTGFKTLVDLVVYDHPERVTRFTLTYILFSNNLQSRLRLRTSTNTRTPALTVMDLFSNASWLEREALDLFGIKFRGLDDFRRLLCDYSFWGFALRRDFPLVGVFTYTFCAFDAQVLTTRNTSGDIFHNLLLNHIK